MVAVEKRILITPITKTVILAIIIIMFSLLVLITVIHIPILNVTEDVVSHQATRTQQYQGQGGQKIPITHQVPL